MRHLVTDYLFSLFSGKARRGDGNDLTANPKKLAAIGKELEQLSNGSMAFPQIPTHEVEMVQTTAELTTVPLYNS